MTAMSPGRAGEASEAVPLQAVAQMLALARVANVEFDLVDRQLVIRATHADWPLWPPLRTLLAEIGTDAIVHYFAETTDEERARLSAIPPAPGPRPIGNRFSLQ
jgi:hypothetical protein